MHKVVDNEDMEELKKVIEKKSIQKKSFYTYVCTNILFNEGWTSKYFFVTYSLIHSFITFSIDKLKKWITSLDGRLPGNMGRCE